MSEAIVLRIIGKAGRLRLECNLQDTLGSLKEKIARKFNVPIEEVGLTRDAQGHQSILGDRRTLDSCRLAAGDEIHVHTRTKAMMDMHKSISQTSISASQVSNKKRKRKETDAKYKTFEAFLDATDFDITNLPLMRSFLPVKKRTSGATPLPPTLSLKHQPYRTVDHLEIMNVKCLGDFVQSWRMETEMLSQRAAYMIGYYVEDDHYGPSGTRAVVEALYEPKQIPGPDNVVLTFDPQLELVERIAAALGLEIVGWLFTHLPREKLITSSEAIIMARMQLDHLHRDRHYTGYPVSTFVTLTISAKESLNGEPGPDAFMISDLGLAMIRDQLLASPSQEDNSTLQLRQPEPDELLPTALEATQEVSKFDCDWLLIRVNDSAPKEPKSLFLRNSFPKEGGTLTDLKKFLSEGGGATDVSWQRVADFNFLLYVGECLGYETSEQLCHAVRDQRDVSPALIDLLKSLCAA